MNQRLWDRSPSLLAVGKEDWNRCDFKCLWNVVRVVHEQTCKVSSKLIENCGHRRGHRQTDVTVAGDFIICPMLCYSNGTDNYSCQERDIFSRTMLIFHRSWLWNCESAWTCRLKQGSAKSGLLAKSGLKLFRSGPRWRLISYNIKSGPCQNTERWAIVFTPSGI